MLMFSEKDTARISLANAIIETDVKSLRNIRPAIVDYFLSFVKNNDVQTICLFWQDFSKDNDRDRAIFLEAIIIEVLSNSSGVFLARQLVDTKLSSNKFNGLIINLIIKSISNWSDDYKTNFSHFILVAADTAKQKNNLAVDKAKELDKAIDEIINKIKGQT